MEFFEVVHSQRSIGKFKPDPVPEEAIWKMLDAAIRAPSRSNTQPWGFNVTSAPVLIIACLVALTSPTSDINSLFAGASIDAAVQNLMLAARAQDLGTVLTTFSIWIGGRTSGRIRAA